MRKTVSILAVTLMVGLSPAAASDFVDTGAQVVLDRDTGLLWQQTENARMSWQAASDRCEDLQLAGRSDWRLPSKEELVTLVDRSRRDPAADTSIFPKVKSTAYWTSTRERDRVWGIGFSDGDEFIFGGTELALYVRCVASAGEMDLLPIADGAPAASEATESIQAVTPPPAPPAPRTVPPATPPAAESASASPVRPPSPVLPDPATMVESWAQAWGQQDLARYLSYYAARFDPPGETTRSRWETSRQRALGRPQWIRIELDNVRVTRQGSGRATVTFVQSYRSDAYQDRVEKTLLLGAEDGSWKILEEKVLRTL